MRRNPRKPLRSAAAVIVNHLHRFRAAWKHRNAEGYIPAFDSRLPTGQASYGTADPDSSGASPYSQ